MSFSNIFQILFIVGSTFPFFIQVCLNNSWWCFLLSFSSFEYQRSFFCQCSYPVILKKILTELQVHHSSFSYSFPVDLTQAFVVDHILFLVSNVISYRCTSQSFTSHYFHWFRSVQDISEDSHFHSQSVHAISRLLSLLSHLIQPAQSFF